MASSPPGPRGLLKRWAIGAITIAVLMVAYFSFGLKPQRCQETPDTTFDANGFILSGKRGGDLFAYLYFGGEKGRTLYANRPEMILLFFIHPQGTPPERIVVRGKNLETGREKDFETVKGTSSYGSDWKANFVFPEPGCWELWPLNFSHEGSIILEVKPSPTS